MSVCPDFKFQTTGTAVIFSGSVGTLVGSSSRLPFIRLNIIVQKSLSALVYAIFLILFVKFPGVQSGKLVTGLDG
jgi:iron-regulated transporter 1